MEFSDLKDALATLIDASSVAEVLRATAELCYHNSDHAANVGDLGERDEKPLNWKHAGELIDQLRPRIAV